MVGFHRKHEIPLGITPVLHICIKSFFFAAEMGSLLSYFGGIPSLAVPSPIHFNFLKLSFEVIFDETRSWFTVYVSHPLDLIPLYLFAFSCYLYIFLPVFFTFL